MKSVPCCVLSEVHRKNRRPLRLRAAANRHRRGDANRREKIQRFGRVFTSLFRILAAIFQILLYDKNGLANKFAALIFNTQQASEFKVPKWRQLNAAKCKFKQH